MKTYRAKFSFKFLECETIGIISKGQMFAVEHDWDLPGPIDDPGFIDRGVEEYWEEV